MRFARPGMMLITVAITGLAPVLTTTTARANTSMGAGHGAVVDQDVVAARQAGKAGIQATGGTRLWVALYKGSNGSGQATAIAASPHGSRVFVTGLNGDSPPHEFYGTVAYNPGTGARLWTASYRGPAGDNFATAIAVSPDGSRVFVTGYSAPTAGAAPDYATVAYAAATGARLWTARYNGPAGDAFPASLAVSPDGSAVFVTGYSATTTGGFAYATVAYDTATGARRWVARYTGSAATGDSTASSVAVSPDGATVFVTGSAATTTSVRDYATIAYAAATGARRWVARYNGPLNKGGFGSSVAVSPDGSAVFVTGATVIKTSSTGDFPVAYSYGTVAYAAATGARRWVARYDGPFGGGSASSVAVSPDGSAVFVTGTSAASASAALTAYATVAYAAATGARLWVARYNGPFNESSATQIVVSPGGSEVFVTGSAVKVFQGIGQYQYATVAYDAVTGSRRWVRLYPNSNRYSPGVGIAASPDGSKVFVTGTTAKPGFNYATVAYTT